MSELRRTEKALRNLVKEQNEEKKVLERKLQKKNDELTKKEEKIDDMKKTITKNSRESSPVKKISFTEQCKQPIVFAGIPVALFTGLLLSFLVRKLFFGKKKKKTVSK